MSKPEVSVIMPVYNAAPYLREAIDSIVAQTFQNWELILLNDGSTDDSLQIAQSYTDSRFKILDSEKNHGLIYQLNRGMEAAQGRYIARLDADDISFPHRLQMQYDFLEMHNEIGLLGGVAEIMGTEKQIAFSQKHDDILIELLYHNPFVHSTIMFRKEIFVANTNGFNAEYKHAEDYHMWHLLAQKTRLANLPHVLVSYRAHENQVSRIYENGLHSSADKVRLKFISAILNQDLSEDNCEAHLALIKGALPNVRPNVVKQWADFIKDRNNILDDKKLNDFLEHRLNIYVKGYFLWFSYCKNPLDWLKNFKVIFSYLSFKEAISALKKTII